MESSSNNLESSKANIFFVGKGAVGRGGEYDALTSHIDHVLFWKFFMIWFYKFLN